MGFNVGDRLAAARLSPISQQGLMTGSALGLTASFVDLPGCSVTVVVPANGAVMTATFAGDFQLATAGTITGVVQLVVDGTAISAPQAIWTPPPNATTSTGGPRGTSANSYTQNLAAGTHTIKLQGKAVITSGTMNLNIGHTQLTVLILP